MLAQQQRQQSTLQQARGKAVEVVNGVKINQQHWSEYIDNTNISQLASLQYLHNYTYLQYSMFPELFMIYINEMDVKELLGLLNSYVGTFMEFFVDGLAYETSYEVNVLLVSKRGRENVRGEMGRLQEMLQSGGLGKMSNGHKIELQKQVLQSLYIIAKQTPTLYNTITTTTKSSTPLQYISQQSQMLQTILKQIQTKKHIVRSLFNLICKLVSKILLERQDIHCLVHSFIPRYLLHCVVSQLQRGVLLLLEQQKQSIEASIRRLRQLLMIKLVPVYVQGYILYTTICTGKMRTIDMSGWDLMVIKDNLQLAVGFNNIVDRLVKENICININNNIAISVNTNCQCEQIPTLNKMFTIITQSLVKVTGNEQKQQRGVKQLTIENIQRVSRMFAKLLLMEERSGEGVSQRKMQVEDSGEWREGQRESKQQIKDQGQLSEDVEYKQQQQQLFQQYAQIEYLSILPQSFLIPYYQILTYLHTPPLYSNSITTINTTQVMKKASSCIQQLTRYINKQIRGVLGNTNINSSGQGEFQQEANTILQKLRVKLQQIQLQAGLVVQLTSMMLEEIDQLLLSVLIVTNQNISSNVQQSQSQQQSIQQKHQRQLLSQLCIQTNKAKNSLYINLLTVRIVKHSIAQRSHSNNNNRHYQYTLQKQLSVNQSVKGKHDSIQKQQQQQQQYQQQYEQLQKLTVSEISKMFDDIFQLAETVDIVVAEQRKSGHPSLESVVYLFSALQLKIQIMQINCQHQHQHGHSQTRCKQHQTQQPHQVYQLMGKVINKYSQPNIVIPNNQLIYVKYIIEMYELFNLFVNNNNSKMRNKTKQEAKGNSNNGKVVEKVCKMIKLMEQRKVDNDDCDININDNAVRVQQLINLSPCIQTYLHTILPPLLSHCICSSKQQQQTNHQSHIIQFPNIISLRINEQTLTSEQLLKYIEKELISSNLRVLKDLCQQQQKSKRRRRKYKQTIQVVDLLNQSVVEKCNSSCKTVVGEIKQGVTSTMSGSSVNINNVNSSSLQQQLTFTITTQQAYTSTRNLLTVMSIKFKSLNMIKQQLTTKGDNCQLQRLFGNCYQKSVGFVLAATELLSSTQLVFHHIDQSITKYLSSTTQPSLQHIYLDQLQFSLNHINTNSLQLSTLIQTELIEFKLMIYKLSPKQIQYLLKEELGLEVTNEDNKNKLLEKIKLINRIIDQLIQFGVFVKSYLQWMLVEITVKIESLCKRNLYKSNDYTIITTPSSYHLLRLLTLISWLPPTQFHTNFEYLQSQLQSNLTNQQPQLTKHLSFKKLSITQHIKHQLHFVQNYQFLEFIYQYVPFQVDSQIEQRELYDVVEEYVKDGENHLYLSAQKLQKIKFNKLSAYLASMKACE